jgi:hypothetical protein
MEAAPGKVDRSRTLDAAPTFQRDIGFRFAEDKFADAPTRPELGKTFRA